ncbi:MAG: type II toxin-antitoxin system VapB family antitoxin [Intrasporangium sp.]|uniref:type II toxin-antitoxin system VapB family antitoxin n=1 Tax=Intrasporangium sp. TaxID=1925024 RepID=UPI0026488598|nr:type II toxin-antitoxin system VapB family antitoxin [Intrasporangium sp.]MDN5794568.1 type II toxin-antitoxin system VapB family antitoxin [Intrasporangium sp.]
MSLNIKNDRVHDLARQAARVTGKTQTGAIEEALERLLRDYGADPDAARVGHTLDVVWAIATEYVRDPGRGDLVIARVEDLYDERTGLPQ